MPQASRVGDSTICIIPPPEQRSIASGQANVLIEGAAAAVIGDVTTHPCSIAEGSSRVKINGKPCAYDGAALSCGGHIISGSSRVTIAS